MKHVKFGNIFVNPDNIETVELYVKRGNNFYIFINLVSGKSIQLEESFTKGVCEALGIDYSAHTYN